MAFATFISKIFGLVRQQAIAAAFGVGPAYGAYSFAYCHSKLFADLVGRHQWSVSHRDRECAGKTQAE